MTTAFHRPKPASRLAAAGAVTVLSAALTFCAAAPAQALPPVGGADSYDVLLDTPLTIGAPGFLANDSDPEGDAIDVHSIWPPAGGVLPGEEFNTLAGGGGFTYYPPTGFTGTRVWTYKLEDQADVSDAITVTFTISGSPAPAGNQAPIGTTDAFDVAQDGGMNLPAPGLLANDSDPDGDALTVVAQGYDTPSLPGEAMTTWADGSLSYTAPTGFVGTRQWWYEVSDGTDTVKTPIVFTIAAAPAGNTAPVANADSYPVLAGSPFDGAAPGVLVNDTDTDGDSLSVAVVQPNGSGVLPGESLVLDLDGGIHYVPPTGYVGPRTWRYRITDGYAQSAFAEVTFQISAAPVVNAAPVAAADAYDVVRNTVLGVAASGVLVNDSDADGDTIAAGWTGEPVGGVLPGESWALDADGSFVYAPPTDFTGVRTWRYEVHDGQADSEWADVVFTIAEPMLPTLPDPAPAPSGPAPTTAGGGEGGSLASTGLDGAGLAGTAGLAGLLVAGGMLARRISRREA
jgi:hypothetical protein